MRFSCWIVAAMMLACVAVASDSYVPKVRRTTADRESDLLEALIRQSRFDEANDLCTSKIAGSAGISLERVRWTVGLSRVKSASLLINGTLSDDQIAQSTTPVTDLLESYGDSEFRVFLQFEQIETLRRACFQDCVAASINGLESEDSQRAVERGARFVRESDLLLKDVQQLRMKAESSPREVNSPMTRDLGELGQRLQVNVVQTMLAISDIFGEESEDQRDAATKALRYSESATQFLPHGSDGWTELQFLRIEAILRTGNTRQAMDEFQSLPRSSSQSLEPSRIALRLRLGMASAQWASVARQLQSFFGNDALASPISFEMDLVRLRFLLRLKSLQSEEVNSLGYNSSDLDKNIREWVDMISLRNGEYERRRAEAIVLSELKLSFGTESTSPQLVNPSIVASQGEEWLRRGDPKRGGELLAAAALADTDSVRAITHATKAAAAYVSIGDSIKAASILYRASMQHPAEPRSSTIAIQAATLLGQTKQEQYGSQIETMLRESIITWPIDGPIAAARTWLIENLKQQGRYIDAAEVSTLNYLSNLNAAKLAEIVSLWQLASELAPSDDQAMLSKRFQEVFGDAGLSAEPLASEGYLASAAFAIDQSQLKALVGTLDTLHGDMAAQFDVPIALLRFRHSLEPTLELQNPDEQWRRAIESRLMNDAIANSRFRKPIAKLIESWPNPSSITLRHVRRLAWLGQLDQARVAAKQLAASSTTRGTTIRQLAAAFEDDEDNAIQGEAVFWLDELASGLPRGCDEWHETRLRAAQLLTSSGQIDEAQKRVQYILLTQPPQDASLKLRYESIKKQGK